MPAERRFARLVGGRRANVVSINQVTDISAALQLAAALSALWQIRRSGRRLAWSLIAAAAMISAASHWVL